jgi:hypothetical protein
MMEGSNLPFMSSEIGSKNWNTYNTSKETAVWNAPDPFRPMRFPENWLYDKSMLET